MLPNILQRALGAPLRLLAGASLTLALAACGGGGGSAGTTPNNPGGGGTQPPVAAKIELVTSASTMSASGADGTEVTVTAVVKDANNNALPGVTVAFNVSSGTISNTVRVSNASGEVIEKLSTKGNPTPRTITITATAGTVSSAVKEVVVQAAASTQSKLLLTSSSGTLDSSGAPGTAVTIRALVLDTSNVVVPNAVVSFSTDSGALSAASRLTDASGIASVTLDTGTDPTTRTIRVTANVAGAPATVVQVAVVGTKITLNAPVTVNAGATTDISVVLTDAAGVPMVNRAVTFSATRNTLTTKSGAASPATTDNTGRVVLSYNAVNAGAETISVSALGQTTSAALSVVASDFSVAVVTDAGVLRSLVDTNSCNRIRIRNFVAGVAQAGMVSISSTRGSIYSDAACSVLAPSSVPLSAGTVDVFVKAVSPGVATLTATSSATSSTVQGTVEFVSPLTSTSIVTLQATPAVVGANQAGSSTQQVVLRAVVTDKPSLGNPVKNAKVAFSILADSSGGTLSQPSEVLTGSDGVATISYVAGTTTTAVNGVQIQARVISDVAPNAIDTTTLTVAQRSLFISAGTGNSILAPTSATYQIDYVVFVSDAAGNAVPNVTITSAVRPRHYYKGQQVLATATGPWVLYRESPFNPITRCLNEDADSDGVLGPGEDVNLNGRLDPVIPMTITASAKTDANGTAVFSLIYPKDRARWLDVDLTFRGTVAGSEASYVGYTMLSGAAGDYASAITAPPGAVSPYGVSTLCSDSL